MSTQKSGSRLRFQSNIQSHTKSKLINSLINQKLSEQKQQVVNRYIKLAKKASQQKPTQQQSQFQIRKRASSLKNHNVSMEKIRDNLTYNSVKPLSQQVQFIISRQYKSPIATEEQVAQLSGLRQKGNLFQVKLSSKDKTGLEYANLQTVKQKNGKDWVKELQESMDNQLWLPGLAHTQTLMEDLQDNGKELKINQLNFDELPIVKSPVFTEHGNSFIPIVSSMRDKNQVSAQQLMSSKNNLSSKLLTVTQVEREQIVYDFKKYHKEDYIALQKWFQKNVLFAHKKYGHKQKPEQKQSLTQQHSKQLLNTLYTIHIAGMQQMIRLNYVQTWQKALVFEKIFWSLIRLFGTLIQQQHKINYSQYKTYHLQIKQQRQMYEQRCKKLQIMMIRAQTQGKSTQVLRQRLSLAYVTYSRVNSHLFKELQFTASKLSSLQNSFNFVNMKFMRLIELLGEQNKIKTIVNEFETVYYLRVGQNEKLEELLRVKTSVQERKKLMKKSAQNQLKQHMEKQSKPLSDPRNKDEFQKAIIRKRQQIESLFTSHQQQVFQTRIGQSIQNIEHQLNKYWLGKEQSLKVKQITHQQLLNFTTADIGTSTLQKFQSSQFGCQFPEQQQKSFAQFLKQQIEKERKQHDRQITKQQDLYVALKELYSESYSKVKYLQTKKSQLNLQLQNTTRLLQKRQQKITQLQSELQIKSTDLLVKTQTIQSLLKEKHNLQKIISQHKESTQQLQHKFTIQIENSQTLVRNNFKMKQQLQNLNTKLAEIQANLQENISKKGIVEVELQKTESDLTQYRDKYQKLHKNLLKLAPSVDSFLDYKRYDRESIVIASVKKDLERFFPQYFCKDSDVFLTKG